MIRILGKKRLIAATILLVINLGLAAAVYMYMAPENEQMEREARTLGAQVMAKRADSEKLRLEHQQIQEQKSYFENLEAAGFFSDQNKVLARTKIEAVQRYSNIISAAYNISPAKIEINPLADGTGHVVLDSPVSLTIEAMDDVDFLNFIYWVENGFPGQVSVNTVTMERVLDINDAALRQIGSGIETTMVKGKISFDWRTLIPDAAAGGTPGLNSNGM